MSFGELNGFVADGEDRLYAAFSYDQTFGELEAQIWERNREELASASFWRRLCLHWRIERAVQRARRELVPRSYDVLYLSQ